MMRARRVLQGVVAVMAVMMAGCHEEPTIVIKFEPTDLYGVRADGGEARPTPSPSPSQSASPSPSPSPVVKRPARECKVAADCVLEPEDCCDCANGGRQHAIAKAHAAASKAARIKRCKGTMCTMMMGLDPSCGKRADCVEGACVMLEKKPGAPPKKK